MEYKIYPKRVNEKLVLELDEDEVKSLGYWISWTNRDIKNGYHKYVDNLINVINSMKKAVEKFQE